MCLKQYFNDLSNRWFLRLGYTGLAWGARMCAFISISEYIDELPKTGLGAQ